MNNFFNIPYLTKELYWFTLSVLLVSFAYPSPPITSVAYISVAFFSFLHLFQFKINKQYFQDKMLFIVVVFLLSNTITHWVIEGVGYSSRLWKLHSFTLVFVAIYLGPKITSPMWERLKLYYIASLVGCSLIGLIKVCVLYYYKLVNSVSYINYAVELGVLTTYFALLVCIGIIFILPNVFTPTSNKKKYLSIVVLTYLVFILSLLSVRISWLALLLILVLAVMYYKVSFKVISLLLSLVLLAGILTFAVADQNVFERLSEVSQVREDIAISDASNRLKLWSCAIEEYTTNASLFLGIGIQQYQEYLNECYYRNELFHAQEQSYNVHNQYLQSLLNTGILGFLSLLALLFYALRRALKEKQPQFVLILLTFAVFFITESFFEKTLGIVAFATFMGVYWNLQTKNEQRT